MKNNKDNTSNELVEQRTDIKWIKRFLFLIWSSCIGVSYCIFDVLDKNTSKLENALQKNQNELEASLKTNIASLEQKLVEKINRNESDIEKLSRNVSSVEKINKYKKIHPDYEKTDWKSVPEKNENIRGLANE